MIKKLEESKIEAFREFVRIVYDEYVSVDYLDEGNQTFYNFISSEEIRKRITQGNYFIVEEENDKIVGALELRNHNHISLLFVDKEYQKRGIAKQLLEAALKYIGKEDSSVTCIEVNSSPYAKEIYKRMGFKEKSGLKEDNGIKYYRLEYEINH